MHLICYNICIYIYMYMFIHIYIMYIMYIVSIGILKPITKGAVFLVKWSIKCSNKYFFEEKKDYLIHNL